MYNTQLAHIHHHGFAEQARQAAGFIQVEMPELTGPLVDLGCGAGDLLWEFRDEVSEAHGFDISPDMIAICRRRMPEYRFQVADLSESDFPRAQVISMVGEILSYATWDVKDLDFLLNTFFKKTASRLLPGGGFLLDFLYAGGDFDYSSFFDTDDYTIFMKSQTSDTTVTREIISFLREGAAYTKARETHRLRIFELEKIVKLLRATGFEVRVLKSYGGLPLPQGRRACWCRI